MRNREDDQQYGGWIDSKIEKHAGEPLGLARRVSKCLRVAITAYCREWLKDDPVGPVGECRAEVSA